MSSSSFEESMPVHTRATSMAEMLGWEPNNLVSEPFVLAPNVNKEHSSSWQGALHGSASSRSGSPTEQRFQSIEGKFLQLNENFDRNLEEFTRSRSGIVFPQISPSVVPTPPPPLDLYGCYQLQQQIPMSPPPPQPLASDYGYSPVMTTSYPTQCQQQIPTTDPYCCYSPQQFQYPTPQYKTAPEPFGYSLTEYSSLPSMENHQQYMAQSSSPYHQPLQISPQMYLQQQYQNDPLVFDEMYVNDGYMQGSQGSHARPVQLDFLGGEQLMWNQHPGLEQPNSSQQQGIHEMQWRQQHCMVERLKEQFQNPMHFFEQPTTGYEQYPSTQPGYDVQPPANSVNDEYQGGPGDTYYGSIKPSLGYAIAPAVSIQPGYSQETGEYVSCDTRMLEGEDKVIVEEAHRRNYHYPYERNLHGVPSSYPQYGHAPSNFHLCEDDIPKESIAIISSDTSVHVRKKSELTEIMASSTSYDEKYNLYSEEEDTSVEATSEFLVPTVDIGSVDELQSDGPPVEVVAMGETTYTLAKLANFVPYTDFLIRLDGDGFELALQFGISVLLATCPYALGLATHDLRVTDKGAYQGVFIKGGNELEKAQKVNTIIFDDTGTLAIGKPAVVHTQLFSRMPLMELCELAAIAEANSEHPLAKTILGNTRRFHQQNGHHDDHMIWDPGESDLLVKVEDLYVSCYYVDSNESNHNAYAISPAHLYSNTPADFDFKLGSLVQGFHSLFEFAEHLASFVDIVFHVIHGRFGEDIGIQELLEKANVPFASTPSDACRQAFDKYNLSVELSQQLFVIVPSFLLQKNEEDKSKLTKIMTALQGKSLPAHLVAVRVWDPGKIRTDHALCLQEFAKISVQTMYDFPYDKGPVIFESLTVHENRILMYTLSQKLTTQGVGIGVYLNVQGDDVNDNSKMQIEDLQHLEMVWDPGIKHWNHFIRLVPKFGEEVSQLVGPSRRKFTKMGITIWDPGSKSIHSLTLRQGQSKGEGMLGPVLHYTYTPLKYQSDSGVSELEYQSIKVFTTLSARTSDHFQLNWLSLH